ncbi:hypothetical protein ACMFGU_09690 [Morganella morganii]|uniref:hypothetical protein n=1 Tax=Morganella morganii TaxID=582 RepID=UPI003CF64832
MVNFIKRLSDYIDGLMPKWASELLITTIIFSCAFYYFYGEIPTKWRFIGTAIISTISSIAICLVVAIITSVLSDKKTKKMFKETCREAGIDCDSNDEEDIKKYRDYLIKRYSSEKFVNRITDVIGVLVVIVSVLSQAAIFISMIFMIFYFPINGYYSEDELLWMPIVWYIILCIVMSIISFFCKLLFNRYPGEARVYNKNLKK